MTDEFEREKVSFEQNFEQARSINSQMNRVPQIAMSLTGGLWFGAGLTEGVDPNIRFLLLLFAGFCNIAFILICMRTRDVFQSYLEKLEAFSKGAYVSGRPENSKTPWLGSYSMISIYASLMSFAAFSSFVGAFAFYWPFSFCKLYGIAALLIALALLAFFVFRKKTSQPDASEKVD